MSDDLVTTTEDVYIPFHGVRQWYRHDYSLQALAEWTRKIRASGAKNVYAYFNNDRDDYAIENARSFDRVLHK